MYDGREAMYGGAAGGGKSYALLIAALQYVHEPTYRALILRRTFKQLSKADAIMSTAAEWLRGTAARWSGETNKWTFPSGATLEFGHMEHEKNKYDYQGAAYHYVGYDELTQFEEPMYTYLFTRQRRRVDSPLPIRMRAASNPGGIGHEWVKQRFITKETRKPSRRFVPAKLSDNPNIDQAGYVESLSEVDPVTRAQLLAGDWDAVAGGRFRREWFKRFERWGGGYKVRKEDTWRYVEKLKCIFQTCDPAASEKRTADYTVLSTWGVTPQNELFWLDCLRVQREIPDLPAILLAEFQRWKPLYTAIERVGANAAVFQLCQRLPMVVKPLDPMGDDKLVRATPAMVLAESGRLYLPQAAEWLDDAEGELLRFTGDPKQDAHDDIVDTYSYAARCLLGVEDNGDGKQRPGVRSSW